MQISDYFGELPEVLKKFLIYKQTIQSCSKSTVFEYMIDLRMFLKYMKAIKCNSETDAETIQKLDITDIDTDFIKDITKEDIYTFLFFLSENRENQTASRARKLSTLKSFFKYLTVKINLTEVNPAKDIDSPSIKYSLPKYLTLDESVTLLETIRNDISNRYRLRDYCIVTMFLNCGMRLSELVGIDLTHIEKDMDKLKILGKRNKERIVYLNDAVKNALSDYLQFRNTMQGIKDKDKEALFISSKLTRISNSGVQKMTEKYFNLAGFGNRNFSTHKLRHTAATLMYRHGNVDVKVLQEILGHEQLNTTQIYTHTDNKQLQDAVSANPLAKIHKNKEKSNE